MRKKNYKIKIFIFKVTRLLKNYDFVHIHGIWAPIQIISILYCCIFRIRFVLHPHGMLLDEAISSGGYFKKTLKNFLVLIKIFR